MSQETAPRATIYTVAQRAGVSVATVSRVLSSPELVRDSTRQRVQGAIAELDFVPHAGASSLASKRHNAHGLVLPELSGVYYSELLMGYESTAADHGQSVLLLIVGDRPDTETRLLRLAGRVDGVVLMGGVTVSAETVAAITRKVPVLGISGAVHDVESFVTESHSSMTALMRHLIDDHHRRRPVFVGDPALATDVQQRYAAYREITAELGEPPAPLPVPYTEADGREIAAAFARGEIDADVLVCANDELALGVLDTLADLGVDVPGDVAVTGFDDVRTARLVRPGLTTVTQPVRQLAAQTAQRMCDLIADGSSTSLAHPPPGHRPTPLPTTVVIRESCGCPRTTQPPHPKEI